MNYNTLNSQLEALTHSDAPWITNDQRFAALLSACAAYSRYFPCSRRFGEAQVTMAANAGATKLYIVGGDFAAGDKVLVGAYSRAITPQSCTVADVSTPAPPPSSGNYGSGEIATAITFEENFTAAIPAGAILTPDTVHGGAAKGLALQAGQDAYYLPADFLKPDQSSFDLAVGAKATVRNGQSFYDASYTLAMRLSGASYGQAANYGPASFGSIGGGSGYPIVGNPYDNPNGSAAAAAATGRLNGEIVYRFHLKQTPPLLTISPAPALSQNLDFFYHGCHVPASLPESARDAILNYARAVCLETQAAAFGQIMDGTDTDSSNAGTRNAASLLEQAQAFYQRFEKEVKFRPVAISG